MPYSVSAYRAEARANLRLALPIIATQISFVGMGTVDTIMAGRLGADALAAVAVGSNVWFLIFLLFLGGFMAVSPIVAHRAGARRPAEETGGFVRGALLAAVVLGVLWTGLMHLIAGPLLRLLSLDAAILIQAENYTWAISWSAVPFCLCFVLRNTAEGHGITKVPMLVGVVGLLVNACANYVLMYGKLGLPALGAVGTAWGTVIATLVMVLGYLVLYARVPVLSALRLLADRRAVRAAEVAEISRLGLPIAAIVAAEAWLFSIGALFMGRFDGNVVAAHQIAINFASMSFTVPLSIGLATTVRVGQAVGAGEVAEFRLRGRVGMGLGASYALMSGALMATIPELLVGIYTDASPVAPMAVRFLGFAALFQIFDCVQATASGALRGLKDTRVPMLVTVCAYWLIGLPVAAGLAFATPLGPSGVWYGFIAGLAAAAVGLALRFRRFTRPEAAAMVPSL